MRGKRGGWVASVLLVGCATASPGVVETRLVAGDAMTCAAGMLSQMGYEVRQADHEEAALEAEVRVDQSPVGAVREIITASLDRSSTPAELTVATRAWEYSPAQHSLPVNRQSVMEVRPSDETLAHSKRVIDTCAG